MNLSLKWKIQLWHAAVLAVVLAVLSVGFYFNERQHRLNAFDAVLDQQIHPVVHELSMNSGSVPRHPRPPDDDLRKHPLMHQKGRESLSDGWEPQKQLAIPKGFNSQELRPEDRRPGAPGFMERRYANYGFYILAWDLITDEPVYASASAPDLLPPPTRLQGYWKRTRDGHYREIFHTNPLLKVIVGFDLMQFYQNLNALKWEIAGASFFIFLVGIFIGSMLVTIALRPLKYIEKTTAAIAAGRLQERIPELKGSRSVELMHLTRDLNNTFDQLESLFQKQIRFTADASHELRTPLTALMAQISLGLNRRRTPEEYEAMLKVCDKSSGRLKMIIEDLLDLSRYDSGTYKLEREQLPLDALVQSLAEELKPYVDEQGSVLKTELKGKTINCDPFRFEQVVTNLVNNALQHNAEPVEITLRTAYEGGQSVVEVIDNGVGIQPENIDKLFDRFFQQDEARKNRAINLNSGLGLSISKAIIEAHGGTLAVRSVPYQETRFTIRLPVRSPEL